MGAMDSLRGKLLIAAPSLEDFFHRTVVLVLEHTEEGAMGVVLNRPTETPVAEAVDRLSELAGPSDRLRLGGPISAESVVALGNFEDPADAARLVVGEVGLIDPEAPDPELRELRVYAGYAGWAPGQLEGELESEAWIVDDARPEDPFHDDDLWPVALQRKGGAYALLATMPADPSLN
ncbi:MAG: putative transcriptional regulator [Solirubrobacteraceae bacterium]|jgi:putative transcriptional regulator|nr:putative transcriptional regulator [Solirubrobacteraceae bacterium]